MLAQLTIDDERAAAAFAHKGSRAIIFALMKSELSLTDLRSATGMSLSLLHYHICKLERLGLVNLAGTRPRAGRQVRLYRASASEFRVPSSIAGQTPGAGLKQEMELALERESARHPSLTCYFLDALGATKMRRAAQAGKERAHERWWQLNLSDSAAAALAQEIAGVLRRYEQSDAASAKPHLCHFVLVER